MAASFPQRPPPHIEIDITSPTPPRCRENAGQGAIEWLERLVLELQGRRFHGRLSVVFADGIIQKAIKEETLIPHNGR